MQPLEDAEQPLGAPWIEARAVVPNRVQLVVGPLRAADLDDGPLAAPREFHRVGDEVHPYLAQQRRVGLRQWQLTDPDVEVARRLGTLQLAGDLLHEGAHVDRALLQRLP